MNRILTIYRDFASETNLSILFVIFLTITQFFQFIYDSLYLDFPYIFLIGYLLCHFCGFLIILRNKIIDKYFILENIFTLIFILYLTVVILFTADIKTFVGLMLYKDGIINWFLLGIEFYSISMILLRQYNSRYQKNFLQNYILILLSSYLVYGLIFISQYRCCAQLYQRMSINSYINFIIIFVIFKLIKFKYNFDKKNIVYSFALILTFINNKARSLAAILYWLVFYIGTNLALIKTNLSKFIKYTFISFFSLIVFIFCSELLHFYLSDSKNFLDFLNNLQLKNFLNSARVQSVVKLDFPNFNPVISRIDIIKNFPIQFMHSPIFGGWYPEIKVSTGEGYYQHSFILSLLTHTGLLGTFIFLISLIKVFKRRKRFFCIIKNNLNSSIDIQFIGVFLISNLHTFFVFPPFWFLFGFIAPGYIVTKSRKT